MTKRRIFHFDGSNGKAEQMQMVLQHYAEVAYPLGGSDCAAASRQALQDIADTIMQNEISEISRRQRPMLKAAVNWFFTESEYALDELDNRYYSLIEQLQR